MSLKQEQIEQIANLSRLMLNEAQITQLTNNMNSTLEYIDILSKVPKEEFEWIDFCDNWILPLREDIVKTWELATREELLSCTSKKIVNHSVSINNIMN